MSITIAGVQYLYPRLDYEFMSNKTSFKLRKADKNFLNYDNLDLNLYLLWSLTYLLVPCLVDPTDRVYSLGMMMFGPILLRWWHRLTWLMATLVSRSRWIFWLSFDGFRLQSPSFLNQILVSTKLRVEVLSKFWLENWLSNQERLTLEQLTSRWLTIVYFLIRSLSFVICWFLKEDEQAIGQA
jgi:hypothetical protein